jgi:ATP-binding cassette subfamily F protein 3
MQKGAARSQAIDKERQKRVRRLEKQLSEAETKISSLEMQIADMNKQLAQLDPSDWKGFQDRTENLKIAEEELMYAMHDWEGLQLSLEGEDGNGLQ